jgi:hypothetical protein
MIEVAKMDVWSQQTSLNNPNSSWNSGNPYEVSDPIAAD